MSGETLGLSGTAAIQVGVGRGHINSLSISPMIQQALLGGAGESVAAAADPHRLHAITKQCADGAPRKLRPHSIPSTCIARSRAELTCVELLQCGCMGRERRLGQVVLQGLEGHFVALHLPAWLHIAQAVAVMTGWVH